MIPTRANTFASRMSFIFPTWRLRLLNDFFWKGESIQTSPLHLGGFIFQTGYTTCITCKHFEKALPNKPLSRFRATGWYGAKGSATQCSEVITTQTTHYLKLNNFRFFEHHRNLSQVHTRVKRSIYPLSGRAARLCVDYEDKV